MSTPAGAKWAYRVASWVGPVFAIIILSTPIRTYRMERWNGPPSITEHDGVSRTLARSRTVREHVNPLDNKKFYADTRSITFKHLRDQHSGKLLSDAEILKRLCIGFWGGNVFWYERAFLRGWQKERVKFVGTEKKQDRGDMFSTFRMGRMDFVLEKGDQLFRAFQVLDMKVAQPGKEKLAAPAKQQPSLQEGLMEQYGVTEKQAAGMAVKEPSSYIDFGYGNSGPGSKFVGVHRFSVTRLPPETDDGTSWQSQKQKEWLEEEGGRVRITFESYTCSPTPGKGWALNDWTWSLHKTYASMLFSNGVSAVVRGYGRSKGS